MMKCPKHSIEPLYDPDILSTVINKRFQKNSARFMFLEKLKSHVLCFISRENIQTDENVQLWERKCN